MSGNKKYPKKKSNPSKIDADFRIKIEKIIENFVQSNDSSFEFPATLTNVERAFVHNLAPKYNLQTKSNGKDENRRLSVYKLRENNDFLNRTVKIELDSEAVNILKQFKSENCAMKPQPSVSTTKHMNSKPFVLSKPPSVPPPSNADNRIQNKRQELPIFAYRQQILQTIENNRIILIQGSTGSGKTTQIPQYILEEANSRNLPCRILCTQPRRISAIASSERVCYERTEGSGGTVGYQIRLESSISQDTNCIFLTPGVFLRYLMSGKPEKLFNNITHILIDEAHERAKENDFLLTSIKEHFEANPRLRLIIMSATMDTGIFSNYFGGCEEVAIATKQFDVTEIYLEEILKQVNFRNQRVDELDAAYKAGNLVATSQSKYLNEEMNELAMDAQLDDETINYVNEILESLTTSDNPEAEFTQFLYLVQAENIPVDFRHKETKMTALMIATGRGFLSTVEELLKLNADPSLKVAFSSGTEMNCVDIAYRMHGVESDIRKLLQHHLDHHKPRELSSIDVYNKALLNIYYDTVLKTKSCGFIIEEGIDHDLIVQLIEKIHNDTPKDGAILVFLPGYDDIIQVSNSIGDRLRNDYTLFLLHSSMKTEDQKNVFKKVFDRRKIILSTNIAESSITIDDVVYVIDSGREKQKSYDAISHSSSLQVQWISKASANQRKGRAGRLRNGVVFRVYSKDRYSSMLETSIPELLRTSLTEICLQTKLMISDTMRIEEFLLKCIASPSLASIRQSIKFLQCLGALDQDESLTLLGSNLAEMPVDAKYAKMLIYGIIFKCLNPVLSIVSILSMGDQVFVLPIRPADRFKSHQVRRTLAENSQSDHFVMLKIFNLWTMLRHDRKFCDENFISSVAMERVKGIRGQISSYLQSSGLTKAGLSALNINSDKWSVIKACLCAGLYPNVARIDRTRKSMYSDIDRKLVFHMSSILSNKERSLDFVKKLPADWVVFEEKNRVGRTSMIRCNTLINSFSLSLSAGASLNSVIEDEDDDDWTDEEDAEGDEEQMTFKIDNLVTFTTGKENGSLVMELRGRLDNLIAQFLSSKNFKPDRDEELLVNTLTTLIEIQERKSGFASVQLEVNGEAQQSWRDRPNENNRQHNPRGNRMRQNNFEGQQSFQGGQNFQAGQNFQGGQNRPRQDFNHHQSSQSRHQSANFSMNQGRQQQNDFQMAQERQQQNGYQTAQGRQARHQQNNNSQRNHQSGHPSSFQQQPKFNRQKYFVMQMNSEQKVQDWARKIISNVEDLGLSQWFMQKLTNVNSTQIFVIFYSTARSEFLGFGDIMPPKNRYQPMQFHLRHLRNLPITEMRQKFMFRNFEIFQNATNQVEEVTSDVGSAILDLLQV